MFKEEHNSRIHLVIALLAIALGWFLKISMIEWCTISILIGAVFASELFNSALENLADHISPEKHENIKKAKDQAAAAVLVFSIVSIVLAFMIFLPKIYQLLFKE